MPNSHSTFSIVVPVYCPNQYLLDMTEHQFFHSIAKNVDKRRAEIIVVDDASPRFSDLEKMIRGVKTRTELNIRLLHNTQNKGFPYNIQRGINESSNEFVAMSANDIYITEGSIDSMLSVLENHPDVAAVGPTTNKTVNKGYKAQAISRFNIKGFTEDEYRKVEEIASRQRTSPRKLLDVNWLIGFFMLLRKEAVVKAGGLDMNYGLGYGEEVDLSLQLRRAGYLLVADRNAFVFHGHPEKMKSPIGPSMTSVASKAVRSWLANQVYFTRKNGLGNMLSLFYDWNIRVRFTEYNPN